MRVSVVWGQRASALAFMVGQLACAAQQKPVEATARTATSEPDPEADGAARGTDEPRAEPATIADASAACERVQANREVPVSCATEYVDDVPSVIVGFRTAEDARKWMQPFYDQVGGPFCSAANRHGREARVYLTIGVGEEQRARRYSCEFGKWGDWFATSGENASPEAASSESAPEGASSESAADPASNPSIADAVQACNDVQANRAVPVTCSTRVVNGLPSMVVGFGTPADVASYLEQVARQVAGPFCDAANRLGRRASLYVTLAQTQARHFDCAEQRWGEWFELPGGDASSPTVTPS